MARPAGLEPATPGLEDPCSIHLSYGRERRNPPIVATRSLSGQGAAFDRLDAHPPELRQHRYRGIASAAGVSVRRPCCECPGQLSRVVGHCGLNSPIMSGPSKKSSPASGEPENLLVRVGRLHRQAEEFQRTVEEELRTTRALLEELHIREAKRRGHGRRMD